MKNKLFYSKDIKFLTHIMKRMEKIDLFFIIHPVAEKIGGNDPSSCKFALSIKIVELYKNKILSIKNYDKIAGDRISFIESRRIIACHINTLHHGMFEFENYNPPLFLCPNINMMNAENNEYIRKEFLSDSFEKRHPIYNYYSSLKDFHNLGMTLPLSLFDWQKEPKYFYKIILCLFLRSFDILYPYFVKKLEPLGIPKIENNIDLFYKPFYGKQEDFIPLFKKNELIEKIQKTNFEIIDVIKNLAERHSLFRIRFLNYREMIFMPDEIKQVFKNDVKKCLEKLPPFN